MEKKRSRRENLPFYLMRSGSNRDSSSPYERKNPIYDMVFKIEMQSPFLPSLKTLYPTKEYNLARQYMNCIYAIFCPLMPRRGADALPYEIQLHCVRFRRQKGNISFFIRGYYQPPPPPLSSSPMCVSVMWLALGRVEGKIGGPA